MSTGQSQGEKKDAKQYNPGEMTVPEFRQYLEDNFKETGEGKPFTLNYAHLLCGYGRLPKEMGGYVLKVRKVRGRKAVTVTDEKFDFNAGNKVKKSKRLFKI